MNAKKLFFSPRLAMTMAVVAIILIAAAGAGATEPSPEGSVTTSFTYQGRLANDGGDPIDDSCDFRFTLWDDPDAGSQVGLLLSLPGVAVTGGLFTVPLDFGEVFDGTALWLEVAVQCSGDPGYSMLMPRQALTAAPYAVYAHTADLLDGSDASAFAPAAHDHWGASWTGSGTGLTLSGGTTGLSGNGATYGVYGESDSIGGYGLYGLASAATGTNYGVYGHAEAADGYAVGTYGRSDSTGGRGVIGYVPSYTGSTMGVHGRSSSNGGFGVHGLADSWYGTTAGVYGRSDSYEGFGVAGHNSDYYYGTGVGVGAWSYGGDLFRGYSGDWPGGTLRFYVDNEGNVHAGGTYNSFKETGGPGSTEYRTLYGMTSAEAWTEDFGRATLNNGTATVSIDPTFARTVNLTLEYHVYLTPICRDLIVLAVTGQQPDSFTVQGATLDGKPSGCAFDYRIVAKQRGHEDERLEKVDIPEPVEVDREDSHAPGLVGPEPEGGR
jgi:hypothetical protein